MRKINVEELPNAMDLLEVNKFVPNNDVWDAAVYDVKSYFESYVSFDITHLIREDWLILVKAVHFHDPKTTLYFIANAAKAEIISL